MSVSQNSQSDRNSSFQALILELILTPSGLVDLGDDAANPLDMDVDALPELLADLDISDEAETVEIAAPAPPSEEIAMEAIATDLEILPFFDPPSEIALDPTSDQGIFTVGESGKVEIDFLFDGGKFKGEVALFSLEGMEEYEGEAYLKEAVNRSLSHSPQGYLAISDASEGAGFSGLTNEPQDWNQGDYQGIKTFEMQSGDTFALLISPDGSIAEAGSNGDPLYLSNDANREGVIADITGHGRAFAIEDAGDNDYNDLIFQVNGATGEALELDDAIDPDLEWRETETGREIIDHLNQQFYSGVFTVGETGEVEIDFLFDGGKYQGEVAIFSLEGMDEFDLDSEAFIQEAARRALSNSTEGHVVIADRIEGARFDGVLGEPKDWNSGQYLGLKTVQMNPGDEFGIMLVPNASVQRVFDNPDIGGSARPLFSMATANPGDEFHVGQIADVTGHGSTFVMEDVRFDHVWADEDYNDIIFQVRGATGEAIALDEVIDPNKDWRDLALGKELLEYAHSRHQSPEVVSPIPDVVLTSGNPQQHIDLSQVFHDPDSPVLEYEIVDGNGDAVNVSLEGDRLQLTKASETGITNVAIRATDEVGNSYIHSLTVITSNLSSEDVSSLNTAFNELQGALNIDGDDPTIGLSSPTAERAIAKLGNVLRNHERLTEILVEPEALAKIGVNSQTMAQLLDSPAFAEDLGAIAGDASLPEILTEGRNPHLDLYQINGVNLAEALQTGEEHPSAFLVDRDRLPEIGAIDFNGEHKQAVIETLRSLNPLAKPQTLNAKRGWENELTSFVDRLVAKGEEQGVVNLSLDLTQMDDEGRITTRYELTPTERQAIQYALENNVLLVVASGNTGDRMSALGAAAQEFDNIVTVGAMDFEGDRADYSSFGEGLSLLAPGGKFEGNHNAFVGTSKATAYVTGAASLVWGANPDLNYQQVKKLLKETALDLGALGWDKETGAGLLNVEEAVRRAKETTPEAIASVGSANLTPFSGEGRVKTGARAASPETEAAIAQLQAEKVNLESQLSSNLTLAELETQVQQQTASALSEYQQISTRAATTGAQAGQLATALELASQHQQIERGRIDGFTGQIQQLQQEIAALNQQKDTLTENYQNSENELSDRIIAVETDLQKVKGNYDNAIAEVSNPPKPEELQEQVVWYRQQATLLAEEKRQHKTIASTQQVLKDRHLHQAAITEQSRIFAEELANTLEAQAELLTDSNTTSEQLIQSYQNIANLAEKLRQHGQASADWHGDKLQELANTTGFTGLLLASQRDNHTRQRNLFEQLANKAEKNYELATYLSGTPSAKLEAMAQEIEAHQIRLQAEQDVLALKTTEYEQNLAAIALKITQAETDIQTLETKQTDAENLAVNAEQRVNNLQNELEILQQDWEDAQTQWQNYLKVNSAFLPQETRKTMIEKRLQDLDAEEVRVRELRGEIQKQLNETPNANLQAQLDEADRYLEELEQERVLASIHEDSIEDSALTSAHRDRLLNRPDELAQEYQTARDRWETAIAQKEIAIDALTQTQALATTERSQLEALRSDLTSVQSQLETARSQVSQLEQDLTKVQQNLDLTNLQLTNQQLLLQSLVERDAALAQGEGFYHDLATESGEKLWYWNDRTQQYEYNTTEAESRQKFLQYSSFLAAERNRVYQATNEAREKIAELEQSRGERETTTSNLATQLTPINNNIPLLEAEVTRLENEITPLAAIVEPILTTEVEREKALQEASDRVDGTVSKLLAAASAQVSAYQRLIDFGVLAAEEDSSYLATEIEPKIRAYIAQLRQQEQEFAAKGFNLGFEDAAKTLETKLAEAEQALIPLELKQELDIHQQLESYGTKERALQALLASEDAAETAIQADTVTAYQALENTVEQDLQQAVEDWTKHFQTGHQLTKELGEEQTQLSQAVDDLLTEIETDFADPHGKYYRSETELKEAISLLSVGVQREDELNNATRSLQGDIANLQLRLKRDKILKEKIATITNPSDAIAVLQEITQQGSQDYQQKLAEAKATYAEESARGSASLSQANWHEEQAKDRWERSRKDGPTWQETRCGKRGKKSGCETITHYDYDWIAWEQHENTAKAYRKDAIAQLSAAEAARKEIERLEPLVEEWNEADRAAESASVSVGQLGNLVRVLEAAGEDIPEAKAQLELLQALLPTLEQQLQQAEQSTAAARLNAGQAWHEYTPLGEDYRQAVAQVLDSQSQWQLQAVEAQQHITEIEGWIERESIALATEIERVAALQSQLEGQLQAIAAQIPTATGAVLVELEAKKAHLEEALGMVTNKVAVLSAQQAALTQKRALLAARNEAIVAEKRLLEAYLASPDADTEALKQQLTDARAVLAEAQKLAEEAEANSQVLTAPLQELQAELLVRNDEHLQAAREQQGILSDLLAATEANANYTLEAAQVQQKLNDLEFQIITRLQEATSAGSEEAKHLLNVAMYGDLSGAAEIYFKDYADLAGDRGSKGVGTEEDAQLAERYQEEWERYKHLKQEARSQADAVAAVKEAAQSQLGALEEQQKAAFESLDRLNEQIATTEGEMTAKEEELAVVEARVEALEGIRQQTEAAFVQMVRLEQLNLAQAQLEQEMAEQRKTEIDEAVAARLERDRLELERDRFEVQFQIEQLQQQQANEELRQALNEVREDLGQGTLSDAIDPNLADRLATLLTTLQALESQQTDLPDDVKALLTEVKGDIALALQGEEAAKIEEKLIQSADILVKQIGESREELSRLEQEELRDRLILQTAGEDLQAASRMMLAEIEKAQLLQTEREIVNPLYLEALTKVAYAEQAVEMSENLAQSLREALEENIKQREKQRKARKKALWNTILSAVTTVLSLVSFMVNPGLALALRAISGGIGAIQAAVNGDWAGAIFSAVMAGASYVSSVASAAVSKTIRTVQSLASGAFKAVRSFKSGDNIMGFLQMIGGVAGAVSAQVVGTAQATAQAAGQAAAAAGKTAEAAAQTAAQAFQQAIASSELGEFGLKIVQSLQNVPVMIHQGIQAIEGGDWVAGLGEVAMAGVALGGTWANDFNSGPDSPAEKTANTLENITHLAAGISKFITEGWDGLLDGINDILAGLGDDIQEYFTALRQEEEEKNQQEKDEEEKDEEEGQQSEGSQDNEGDNEDEKEEQQSEGLQDNEDNKNDPTENPETLRQKSFESLISEIEKLPESQKFVAITQILQVSSPDLRNQLMEEFGQQYLKAMSKLSFEQQSEFLDSLPEPIKALVIAEIQKQYPTPDDWQKANPILVASTVWPIASMDSQSKLKEKIYGVTPYDLNGDGNFDAALDSETYSEITTLLPSLNPQAAAPAITPVEFKKLTTKLGSLSKATQNSDFAKAVKSFSSQLQGQYLSSLDGVSSDNFKIIVEALKLWEQDPGDLWGTSGWGIGWGIGGFGLGDREMSAPQYANVPTTQYKCNAYVSEVMYKSHGVTHYVLPATEQPGKYFPYRASTWGDTNATIEHFKVVESPQAGDVWSDGVHTGIYLGKFNKMKIYISARTLPADGTNSGIQHEHGIQIKDLPDGGTFRRYSPPPSIPIPNLLPRSTPIPPQN
ncbi:MAG: DUF4114 domain-containing protein [Cyanobacteria bacterium P01_E01_bin.42]